MARRHRYQGRLVLITGASSGIGAALARQFAREGARLVLCARRQDRLRAIAAECQRLGSEAAIAECDVTREGDMERLVELARAKFGRIDVVVANAGFGVAGRFENLTLDDYRRQFETNVFGVIRTVKATLDDLKKSKGKLAVIGSVAGHVALPGSSPYSMSKFAVRALAEALRDELGPQGVSVTLISPGFVASEIRKVDNRGRYHSDAKDPVPAWIQVSAESAAREILGAIHRGSRECVVTGHGKAIVLLNRLAPWLVNLLKARGLQGRPEPRAASQD